MVKNTETNGANEMDRSEYTARVNDAAGTDIDILESNWQAALEDEDFTMAGRIQGLIYIARAAAGLDPKTGLDIS
jgi:hypothetical protein